MLAASWVFVGSGCASGAKSEVVVMGMIHSGHLTSKSYGIERVKSLVRAIDPDFILCEIPPDRFEAAMGEFEETGQVTEARVSRFPEYVQAVFPLTRKMDFEIVPCAAWTRAMADDRRAKMESYKTTRPEDWEAMTRAEEEADARLAEEGLDDDPLKIDLPRYDEIVKEGLEPYDRLFNDELGAGGWTNINKAHYALIAAALDQHAGEGKRFLIMFGAWHKYWILEQLRKRDDIVLRSLGDVESRKSKDER